MTSPIALMTATPAVLRTTLVFVLILILIRRKWMLGNAFAAGALLTGLVFAMPAPEIGLAALRAVTDAKSLSLALIVSLILVLSTSMEHTGQMEKMLAGFRGLIRRPLLNLVLFPALIGLLPMPGGAVFSAPMVRDLGKDSGLSAEQLSFINYWFRHIWEYFWPLYPGILLTTTLAALDLTRLVLTLFPLTLMAAFAGALQLRNADMSQAPSTASSGASLSRFLLEIAPILQVILVGIAGGSLCQKLFPGHLIAREAALITGLLITIFWIWQRGGLRLEQRLRILRDRGILKMAYMVFAILAFKGVLEDSMSVRLISEELLGWHVPLMLVTALLPFIIGAVTGITIAFVGATFPILVPLILGAGEGPYMMAYMMLAITSGFCGVLLSPLHLCLILSNTYFHADTGSIYRMLWRPCLLILLTGLLYFPVLRFLFQA